MHVEAVCAIGFLAGLVEFARLFCEAPKAGDA